MKTNNLYFNICIIGHYHGPDSEEYYNQVYYFTLKINKLFF